VDALVTKLSDQGVLGVVVAILCVVIGVLYRRNEKQQDKIQAILEDIDHKTIVALTNVNNVLGDVVAGQKEGAEASRNVSESVKLLNETLRSK